MKKIFGFILFIFCFTLILSAQTDSTKQRPPLWKERIFIGGGFGAFFGQPTIINISPVVGYRLTEKVATGIGTTYIYINDRAVNDDTHIYGGNVFGRYNFVKTVFAHTELEVLSLEAWDIKDRSYKRRTAPAFLIGGGYQQNFGRNSFFSLMILWDIIEDDFYPNENPIFRGGFGIGL